MKIVLGIDWGYIKGKGKPNRIRRIMTEFKYAAQRFIRGYDDSMFYNFCDYLDLLIMEDLRYMIKHRRGTPELNTGGGYDKQREDFTRILKQMLNHFEQSRNKDNSEPAREEHHGKALTMLKQYYKYLWD